MCDRFGVLVVSVRLPATNAAIGSDSVLSHTHYKYSGCFAGSHRQWSRLVEHSHSQESQGGQRAAAFTDFTIRGFWHPIKVSVQVWSHFQDDVVETRQRTIDWAQNAWISLQGV